MRRKLLWLAVFALMTLGLTVPAVTMDGVAKAAGPCGTLGAAPTYKHVLWIWFENKSYSSIIGSSSAPYFNAVASECGLASNFHNTSHPSLPNYIAATSGSATSLTGEIPLTAYADCSPSFICETSATSIFGQGETWKSYQESMPCDPLGGDHGWAAPVT